MPAVDRKHPWYKLHRWTNKALNALVPHHGISDWFVRVFYCLAALIPILLAVLQFCESNDQPLIEPWKSIVAFIYHHRLVVSVVLATVQVALVFAIWVLSVLRPIDFEKAEAILEMAVDTHFSERDHKSHHYRATVFKIRGCFLLGGEWMGIVCRSGETYLRSGTVFYLDRDEPEKSTSLLGVCFAAQGATIVKTDPLPVSSKADYMQECRLAEIEFEKMNMKSSVILVTGIKRPDGKLWGFLVLDTTDESMCPKHSGIRGKPQHESDIGRAAAVLGMLI